MKCKNCGKKVFRDIVFEGKKTGWRMCVHCKTLHMFGWQKYKENNKGGFEYDFEN